MATVSQQAPNSVPRVSVAMVTYNHEKYIAQAIESVLMQVAKFPVELIIGEDCSTDGTRALVKQYAERYKNVIRTLLHERNLGAYKNYAAVMAACNAEYIAYLEGDDYWTDAGKLTRQVELMDANPDMSFCFHRVGELDASQGKETVVLPTHDLSDFKDPVEELIRRNFIHSNSPMFRRSKIPVFDRGFEDLKLGDWPLSIMMALNGKMGFLPEKMAVYRIHSESTWSSKDQDARNLETYLMFYYLFQKRLRPYESSIAQSALKFSRLVLDHRRSQGLRHNIPLIVASLKICHRTDLPNIMVHAVWLVFYFILAERKGAWYDVLCNAGRALINPPIGSFLHAAQVRIAKWRS